MDQKQKKIELVHDLIRTIDDGLKVVHTGSMSYKMDRLVDEWYLNSKQKLKDVLGSSIESRFPKFKPYQVISSSYDEGDLLYDKIEFYKQQIHTLSEILNKYPENILDPNFLKSGPRLDELLNLHEKIVEISSVKFLDGHYRSAVTEAFLCVNNRVKAIYKLETNNEKDGKGLMTAAFGGTIPKIKLSRLETVSETDLQEGFMHLFAGSMQGIRNPLTHEQEEIAKEIAINYLHLASLLMKKLDQKL